MKIKRKRERRSWWPPPLAEVLFLAVGLGLYYTWKWICLAFGGGEGERRFYTFAGVLTIIAVSCVAVIWWGLRLRPAAR